MVVALPKQPPYTVDDLDHFPSDGNRYELIDGDLHVSAAPSHLHQRVLTSLAVGLTNICPAEFELLVAPLDVVLGPATVFEPDVLVIPAGKPRGARIHEAPVLVVEVLSPSTRYFDLGTKRPVYRDAGVGGLWVLDPHERSIRAWRWDGPDESIAMASGDEALHLDHPFPVRIVPGRLTEPGGWRAVTAG